MSDSRDAVELQIESLNKKLALARNLAWLTGVLFLGTVSVATWAWTSLTSDFVRSTDTIRLYVVDKNSTKYVLDVDNLLNGESEARNVSATPGSENAFSIEIVK